MPALRPDLYISADIETDGPIPGPYSMLSFGLTVVGAYDGEAFQKHPPGATTFYRELQPISHEFEVEALAVNGLDRQRLFDSGSEPARAMTEASHWVREVAGHGRPVLVAYPVAYDWSFLYWYFVRFSMTGSPFGFSSCLDIRTLYQALSGSVFDASGKDHMSSELLPNAPHTHHALDDAVEQGELFANIFIAALLRRDERPQGAAPGGPSWLSQHLTPYAR